MSTWESKIPEKPGWYWCDICGRCWHEACSCGDGEDDCDDYDDYYDDERLPK